jgi:hypothetical protein
VVVPLRIAMCEGGKREVFTIRSERFSVLTVLIRHECGRNLSAAVSQKAASRGLVASPMCRWAMSWVGKLCGKPSKPSASLVESQW